MKLDFKAILSILFLFLYLYSFTQSTQKADDLMKDYKYAEAIIELKPLAAKGNIQAIRRIAECYRKTNDFINAEKYYSIVVADKNTNKKNLLYYGQVLMNNNKYKEANKWLTDYLNTKPNDSVLVKTLLESCNKATANTTTIRKIKLNNLEWINSPASDFCAIDYNNQIIFTSSRQGKLNAYDGMSYSKVYFAEKKSDSIYNIEPLKGIINSKSYNSGPATIDLKNNKIYYTKNNVQYGDAIKNKKGDVTLKIFEAKLEDNSTKDFKELAFNDVEYSCAYPTINKEGNKIFFTSDRGGGFGGKDIYFSTFTNGVWTKPKNAGKNINTIGDERYPFIHVDGTLYFSSTGHEGYGGMDIFKASTNKTGEFLNVENMGALINSSADDFGFYLDTNFTKGYISSNRLGGKGADDIYIFNFEDIPMKFTAYHENNLIDSVSISIKNKENSNTIFTNKFGIAENYLLPNQQYLFTISKEGFEQQEIIIDTPNHHKPIHKNILLKKIEN